MRKAYRLAMHVQEAVNLETGQSLDIQIAVLSSTLGELETTVFVLQTPKKPEMETQK